VLGVAGLLLGDWPAQAAEPTAEQIEFFEKKVRPVFAEHCYECHSRKAAKRRAGLLLDSRSGILKGGDNGPLFELGKPEDSRLIEAINYKNPTLQMPKKGKLPDAVIADLAAWVKMGAPVPPEGAAVVEDKPTFDLEKRRREHWAWQPVRWLEAPAVKDKAWVKNQVDAFILAKLEAKGLAPAGPADQRAWLRRVSYDLIGLPPTPEEVEAFLKVGAKPQAAEKVVDRLLASPHFGECWGRHWLDLVRYAESRGHEFDYTIPNAYQYRDYVIRALNADVPYDQFVMEHLAGDLLEKPRLDRTEGFNESILGTGFWFLGEELHSPVDLRQDQADRFDNRIDVFGKTFLGLTVACARCHDHKFDAISAKDYYALYGLIESSSYRQVRFDGWETNRKVAAQLDALRDKSGREMRHRLVQSVRPLVEDLGAYLLAAREGILAGPEHASRGKVFSAAYLAKLQEIARKAKLDADLLAAWVGAILQAADDPRDPLHLWAKVASDLGAKEPRRLAEIAKSLANDRAETKDEIVIDYGRSGPDDWLPDDVSFGAGPVRPGQVMVNRKADRPEVRLIDYAAAEFDPIWECLKATRGAQTDAGALGEKMPRAGRTIRTPNFKIRAGQLFYLVRGAGMAYAAVDGHSLIAGPLHGQLLMTFPTSDEFRWVGHDLTPYMGQNVHVEFTAAPGSSFAVAMVVQAEQRPSLALPPRTDWRAFLAVCEEDKASLEKLATAYQRWFAEALDRMRADKSAEAERASADARLVNWLCGKSDLYAKGDAAARKELDKAAAEYLAERRKLAAAIKPESRLALAIQDANGVDERVFVRGNPRNPGAAAPRRFLEALAGPERIKAGRGSGRLELARQMTDPKLNPVLARVMVNRIWHHLFGRGIVASVDNFGVLGETPSHPELLDYLADRFVKEGWSVKKMIRELVLSNTYHMASRAEARADRDDPQDVWLHRMRVRRLEGEAIRDAMLAVSGRLDPKLYGPPVPIHLTLFLDGRGKPADGPLDGDGRRSIYLAVRRNFLSPMLLAFDTPSPFSTMGRRTVSNVPAQALILLNDPFVHQQAEVWAKRVLAEQGTDKERIGRMYLAAFGRPPTDGELNDCRAFLEQEGKHAARNADDVAVWADLAHVMFNVKEFIFVN
jgi:hypothetical protein